MKESVRSGRRTAGKGVKMGLSMIAVILLMSSLLGCQDGTGDADSNASDAPVSLIEEIELPKIEVTNPKLRLLVPDITLVNPAEKYLKSEYGITELETVYTPPDEKRTKLVNSIMANDFYDLYWDDYAPTLISGGYVQAVDIDMSTALWREVEEGNQQYMWNGSRYYVVPGFKLYNGVYYNKDMFDEAGETYPTDLFDKGEWDWDKMLELAQTLTLDSNRDGTPEQYGLGTDEPEHLLYTTGKHFITFMPDGTARNNIQSPEVARAVAYHMELLQSKTMVPSNARQSVGEGSVAMCIGHRWYSNGYAKLIKTDSVGFVPLPRDPDADQYYTELEGGGIFIPKGAPNKEGAIAALHTFRYTMLSDEYRRSLYERDIENGYWTEELQKEMEKNALCDAGVLRNWEGFGMGDHYSDIYSRPSSGEPWETIAAELAPKIDAKIKELYEA